MNEFQPDYRHLLSVVNNQKPKRLPLYEHSIDTQYIAKDLGEDVELQGTQASDYENYYTRIINFWKTKTYDGFAYEASICPLFPDHGAIYGGKAGPIQSREDFNAYPFEEISSKFWTQYTPHLQAIRKVMPAGMKAYGGCGYGIFESCQDLVGYEQLCLMSYLDPDLFRDVVIRVGDLYVELWSELIKQYDDVFVFYRMGDDLGFKTSTLMEPDTYRKHFFPQYKRVIDLAHQADKKFLLHSCGNIFDVMDDLIALDIDAKHSNEDEIAPFDKWIELYNSRIGLFGGIDVNILTLKKYEEVYEIVKQRGTKYRSLSNGYGLGSGNSIPDYVPVEGFNAMIDAATAIRAEELIG